MICILLRKYLGCQSGRGEQFAEVATDIADLSDLLHSPQVAIIVLLQPNDAIATVPKRLLSLIVPFFDDLLSSDPEAGNGNP